MMFSCKSCREWEKQFRALQLELNDTRESLRKREDEWSDERKDLIDRILAIEKPTAIATIMRREPIERKKERPFLNIPGLQPDLRPPSPKKN